MSSPGKMQSFLLLSRLVFGLRRRIQVSVDAPLMEELGFGLREVMILRSIEVGEKSPSRISDLIGSPLASISRSLNLLEDLGMIERVQGTRDKRRSVLELTSVGEASVRRAREIMQIVLTAEYEHVSEPDLVEAVLALSRLAITMGERSEYFED